MTLSPRLQRRLEADRDRFLADIEVAEAADQAEAVKLAGALLEAADEQHLAVIFEQFVLAGLMALRLGRAFAVGRGRRGGGALGALGRCCLGHGDSCWLFEGRLYGGKRDGVQLVPRGAPSFRRKRESMNTSRARTAVFMDPGSSPG
jgi:hypothetical protein